MKTISYEIKTALGIRVHSLAELSSIAGKYKSLIYGSTGEFKADLKSLLSVIVLEFHQGDLFTVTIDGPDEDDAAMAIDDFFQKVE